MSLTLDATTTPLIVGEGQYRYEVVHDWAKLPQGWSFSEVAAVGVDTRDNVYVFNRSEHPMMVFDRDGNFLRSWGEGVFPRAHGLHMAPDDTIFLTDDGDQTVRRCTLDGKVLLTLGTPGKPSGFMSGLPFHRCTHTALSPSGDIYVSDGYCNARVHKFAPDGRHILSWGSPGIGPGEFNIPHNITCDADGWVYVADRENHRVQIFDGNGRYETQWNNIHRPAALFMPAGKCPICYVGELGPGVSLNRNFPNLGPRLSILDNSGKLLARIGGLHPGFGPEEFIGPHGIAVDSRGDVYIGETSRVFYRGFWPNQPIPDDLRCLRKLRKVG
jgi:DNA-binding beta-propeller fold protein YncE